MDGVTNSGVSQAGPLIAFADAAVASRNTGAHSLDFARAELVRAVGAEAMVDTAAVIGGFDGITRIADATGTPLETSKAEQTADLRAEMRIDELGAAKWQQSTRKP